MATLSAIVDYLDILLQPAAFQDYCPNGLQVEGRPEVNVLISGVTACQALIDAAIEQQADAVLVHHGYFWKGEDPGITGMKQRRIKALLENGISLLAYHLPLDIHDEVGNNVQLAERLGFEIEGSLAEGSGPPLVLHGRLPGNPSPEALAEHIGRRLGRAPLHIPGRPVDTIRRLAWCSGAAQQFIELAADAGMDAYLSGEISEQTVHIARETGIHYYAAGHHVTERYGVQALGTRLAHEFGLQHTFLDIDNPV